MVHAQCCLRIQDKAWKLPLGTENQYIKHHTEHIIDGKGSGLARIMPKFLRSRLCVVELWLVSLFVPILLVLKFSAVSLRGFFVFLFFNQSFYFKVT